MRVVQVAVEFAPIAKAGGLGEVLVGLSRELIAQGVEVDVFLPKYDILPPLDNLKLELERFECLGVSNAMWSAEVQGCKVHLLETHHPGKLFDRGKIYGCEDDAVRFLYFGRAVLEFLKVQNRPIDVLHVHDWHTGWMTQLVKSMSVQTKTVLSIHNLEYQGRCSPGELAAIELPSDGFQDPVYPEAMNLLKGGLLHSDAIVAVSPSYAEEIQTPQFGFHLDPVLHTQRHKLSGILNGIDLDLWQPSGEDRRQAQEALEQRFGLQGEGRPWFGVISRLVSQKGPELMEVALHWAVKNGGVFVLLGSAPNQTLQHHFEKLARHYKDSGQVAIHLAHDEELARTLFGAIDFLVIPSRFEPCGLTQMIAMRYGVVPIVRETGGLKDTVFDCDDAQIPAAQRNGFVFHGAIPRAVTNCAFREDSSGPAAQNRAASDIKNITTQPDFAQMDHCNLSKSAICDRSRYFTETLDRALNVWQNEPDRFKALIECGRATDVSWQGPAKKYLGLYERL